MNTLKLALVAGALCAVSACGALPTPSTEPATEGAHDPNAVPTEFTLYEAQPLLVVQLEATPDGYKLVDAVEGSGVPTSTILQSRPLRLSARSGDKTLATVTLDDPLVVHTTGSTRPETALLDSAVVTVTFADPQAIDQVLVELSDPNGKVVYTEAFPVR